MSMALADIDGDGDLDLYVANYRTSTIRSTGFNVLNVNGRRSILPEDRDQLEYTPEGRVLEHGEPDALYLNLGEARFQPVSWTHGVFRDESGIPLTQAPRDWGQAALFRDLNGDGFPDLYVCNDFQSPDRIWINDGQGHFQALASTALRNTPTFSMSIDCGDLNRDGHDDLLIVDMLDPGHRLRMAHSSGIMAAAGDFETARNRPQLNRNTLHFGRGDGTFAELAYLVGLEASGWTWSTIFLDVDLDGFEDVLMTTGHLFDTQDLDANARIQANGPYRKDQIPQKLLMYPRLPQAKSLYRNLGGVRFEEVGREWGFGDEGVAHGMCVADLDNDGDHDVVVNELNLVAGLFVDESGRLGHVHLEPFHEDFERQALLPRRMSQLGPGVGWMDLDGDGNEDVVIGSGKGGSLSGYLGDGRGGFRRMEGMPLGQMTGRDQTGIVGWRRGEGTMMVLSGTANYEDGVVGGSSVRVYDLGNKRVEDALPAWEASAGPLALGGLAEDGSLSLFIGGRVTVGGYPKACSSKVYANRGGKWELDEVNTEVLKEVGMVSGAVWTDLDGDGRSELVLACEWGPVKVFRNGGGKLEEATTAWGLGGSVGGWNGIGGGDFDGDGRMDLVVSNWGLNTGYRASVEEPRRLYVADLVGNGQESLMEAWKDRSMGKWVPEVDRDGLGKEWPWVQAKYPRHREYAEASVEEILGEAGKKTRVLEANWLETTVFLNRGKRFEVGKLPVEAQWSPGFGVNVADFDGDGKEDVFVSQNFFAVPMRTSRSDAGRGLVLRGDGRGGFEAMKGQESGVKVYGEQRGSAVGDYDGDGRVDLLVSQNGGETKLYRNARGKVGLRVRLKGSENNREGIGAVIRLGEGNGKWGAAREVHAGSGYWSMDSVVTVMARPEGARRIAVRWPGKGPVVESELPPGAREVVVHHNGTVEALR